MPDGLLAVTLWQDQALSPARFVDILPRFARRPRHLASFDVMGSEHCWTENPKISVVVPVYQVEAYLAKCLGSILSQADDRIEVIGVDDCSPDSCGLILEEYARHDSRVRVSHLPANVGLGRARNAGIDQAKGDYLWFVDGDDWLPAGAVHAVIERLALTNPDVLIIDHVELSDEATPDLVGVNDALAEPTTPFRLSQRPQLLRLAQSACTKVVRRSFLADVGLRFRSGWYEDCSFSHPLLMAAKHIDVLNRVCYCYRQSRSDAITKSVSHRHFDVFDQYKWLFEMVDKSAGAYEEFRPELFRLMINHYLIIVGNGQRVPADKRQEFFRRIAEEYQRWLPTDGYPVPRGAIGLKHRLVRYNAYRTYVVLRHVYRVISTLRRSAVM